MQRTEAEHSEGFKEENRSPVCGRVHFCGQGGRWHALSYLGWVSSYKFHWKWDSDCFQPNPYNGTFIHLAFLSEDPVTAPVPGLLLFPVRLGRMPLQHLSSCLFAHSKHPARPGFLQMSTCQTLILGSVDSMGSNCVLEKGTQIHWILWKGGLDNQRGMTITTYQVPGIIEVLSLLHTI
jgi:hypothetical protein